MVHSWRRVLLPLCSYVFCRVHYLGPTINVASVPGVLTLTASATKLDQTLVRSQAEVSTWTVASWKSRSMTAHRGERKASRTGRLGAEAEELIGFISALQMNHFIAA